MGLRFVGYLLGFLAVPCIIPMVAIGLTFITSQCKSGGSQHSCYLGIELLTVAFIPLNLLIIGVLMIVIIPHAAPPKGLAWFVFLFACATTACYLGAGLAFVIADCPVDKSSEKCFLGIIYMCSAAGMGGLLYLALAMLLSVLGSKQALVWEQLMQPAKPLVPLMSKHDQERAAKFLG